MRPGALCAAALCAALLLSACGSQGQTPRVESTPPAEQALPVQEALSGEGAAQAIPQPEETPEAPPADPAPAELPEKKEEVQMLKIQIGEDILYAVLEDNSSAEALREKLLAEPLTLEMHDYGGFEKVGDLPWTLPRNDRQITTQPGDVILYLGSQLTLYYDVNSWSFTRVARIEEATGAQLRELLGEGAVTITFSVE